MALNIIWSPQGSQVVTMNCLCNQILLEGTRGGGKTDVQVMFFRRFVGKGYGQFWKGIIFDREYKNLDDLISKTQRWFKQFDDGAKFLKGGADYKWVWPTGEELLFRQLKTMDDYWKYHGQEFPFIGHNELTKQPNSELYDAMQSCNRSSFVPSRNSPKAMLARGEMLPEIPLITFSTTNPFGVGHNWVKAKFIDVAPPNTVVRKEFNILNPRTQKKEVIMKTQVRLFSSFVDNIYLSPEYVAELMAIKDVNKRKAWLYGDWDITSGGMFDDIWSAQWNVRKPFNVPADWPIFRSFDWGSSKPFSVGWWTIADGTDYQDCDGEWHSTVPGDLIRIGELYGWNGVPNTGLRWTSDKISEHIIRREKKLGIYGRVTPGPADTSIWDEMDGRSIAREMAKPVSIDGAIHKGVVWTKANKNPGSRRNGWELMRIAIGNAIPEEDTPGVMRPRENPGLFVVNTCEQFLRTVPTIPRDDKDLDDVNTDAEDHTADEARYMILSVGNMFKSKTTTGLGG